MSQSVIVYGIDESVSKKYASRIALAFGLHEIVFEREFPPKSEGYLVLRKNEPNGLFRTYGRSFADVANCINFFISTTEWFHWNVFPSRFGEYEVVRFAGSTKYPYVIRLCFGKDGWFHTGGIPELGMAGQSVKLVSGELWRGLSREPIYLDGEP